MYRNEKELHIKVVEYIRAHYPELLVDAGLGEFQTTSERRIEAWKKVTPQENQIY